MKNKEKYFDEIIESFTSDECTMCDFKKNYVLCLDSCTGISCVKCCERTKEWLEQEYQEPPILDEKEKEYLSAVIKPWRDKVISIVKKRYNKLGYIVINYCDDRGYVDAVGLPCFKADTMYKGMELNKEYTLEELGL